MDMAANGDKNEFVVQRNKLNLLTSQKGKNLQRVKMLFSVDVSITSKGDQSGEWVTVKGLPDNREKATEYIKSLCNPDHELRIHYPPSMHHDLIGPGGVAHRELETSSGAVVIFENGQVRLLGSQMAVLLASSQIEDAIKRFQAEKDMELAKAAAESFDINAELGRVLRRSESDVPVEEYQSQPEPIRRAILVELSDLLSKTDIDNDDEGGFDQPSDIKTASSVSSAEATPVTTNSARSLWNIDQFHMSVQKQQNAGVAESLCKRNSPADDHADVIHDNAAGSTAKKKRKRKSGRKEKSVGSDVAPTGPGALESDSLRPAASTENGATAMLACNFSFQNSTKRSLPAVSPAATTPLSVSSSQYLQYPMPNKATSVSDIRPVQFDRVITSGSTLPSTSMNISGPGLNQHVALGISQPRPITISNLSRNHQLQPALLGDRATPALPTAAPPLTNHSAQLLKPDELGSDLGTPPALAGDSEARHTHSNHFTSQTLTERQKPSQPNTWPTPRDAFAEDPCTSHWQPQGMPVHQGMHEQQFKPHNPPPERPQPASHADAAVSQLQTLAGPHHASARPVRQLHHHHNYLRPGFNGHPRHMVPQPSLQPVTGRPGALRPIVIDASNVAMHHGNGHVFSCKGIRIAVDWFLAQGHEVTAMVPNHRQGPSSPNNPVRDQHILQMLKDRGQLVFTPSRKIGNRRIVCYDDRFIVRAATANGGIIVSNDQYRDLQQENHEWKAVIEQRLLQYAFVGDLFIPADDPLGRGGPPLDKFLRF